MKTLVLIPAKNESKKISSVVTEVVNLGYDVLVIDDGSSDNTGQLAREAGALVATHIINRGQGAAIKTGVSYAINKKYEAVVFFDADGQMMAQEIGMMIDALSEAGCDVALGSRFLGQAHGMPKLKWLTLRLALIFSRLVTGLPLTDVHNGFQAWKTAGLKSINLIQDRQAYASEILQEIADHRLKYREVPVTIYYTSYSKSKGQSIFNAFNILWDLFVKK